MVSVASERSQSFAAIVGHTITRALCPRAAQFQHTVGPGDCFSRTKLVLVVAHVIDVIVRVVYVHDMYNVLAVLDVHIAIYTIVVFDCV